MDLRLGSGTVGRRHRRCSLPLLIGADNMRGKFVGIAALGLGVAAVAGIVFAGSPSRGSAEPAPEKVVIHTDRYEVASASELADLSEQVVSGEFIGVARSGMGGEYGLAQPDDAAQPPVQVWKFKVDKTLKGAEKGEVLVVRYDAGKVASDDSPVSGGMRAVLFLSREVNGARVVVGGDQGIILRSAGDKLSPINREVKALPDAGSQEALTRTVKD
ncbi:hypothetical protein ACFY36_05210 [Actinoplanes sp. NPDC000266]